MQDGYMAICPSHNDRKPSLHLTLTEDPNIPLIHCFAGCKYSAIYSTTKALEPHFRNNGHSHVGTGQLVVISDKTEPLDKWSAYTGVPREFWEQLGVKQQDQNVLFTWPWITNMKRRNPWNKAISWEPSKPPFIPIWPEPEVNADLTNIILTEGERDCGILRYLGLDAFTVGGAATRLEELVIKGLQRRGVKTITLVYDADKAGKDEALKRKHELELEGFDVYTKDISQLMLTRDDGWTEENDIGDAFLRVGTDLPQLIDDCPELKPKPLAVSAVEYASTAPVDVPWLVKPFLAQGSVTLLSGQPKAGKSMWCFKLMKEMHHGGVFLDQRVHKGKVLVLTENSPLAFKAKMDSVLGPRHDHVLVVSRFNRELLELPWQTTIRRLAQEAVGEGVSLMVIDTLAAWARLEDENDASQVYAALAPIREVADRLNLGVLCIHHLAKGSDSPRGSGVFQAESDTLLRLTGEGVAPRVLDIKSVLLPDTPDPIRFSLEKGEYVIIDGTDEESLALLDLLPGPEDDPISLNQVMEIGDIEKTSANTDTVRLRLETLWKAGKAQKIPQGAGRPTLWRQRQLVKVHIRGVSKND